MKTRILLASMIATLVLGGWAFARPDGTKAGRSGDRDQIRRMAGRMLERPEILEKLELKDEQVEALRQAQYEKQKKHIDLKAGAEMAQIELRHLLSQDTPDEEAVMAAVEEAGKARTALQKSDVQHMLKRRAIIGPEKCREMHSLIRKHMRTRMQAQRHRGGSDRGRPGGKDQHGPGPRGDRRHRGHNEGRSDRGPQSFGPGPEAMGQRPQPEPMAGDLDTLDLPDPLSDTMTEDTF